ncbi:MAG: D-alanyl-D-alanine carboxypeptidase family protein [Myxococcota bacterium]
MLLEPVHKVQRKKRQLKKKRLLLLGCLLAITTCVAIRQQAPNNTHTTTHELTANAANVHPQAPAVPLSPPAPPAVAARAWILMDANSNAILAQHNAHLPLPPASTTKVMTLYVLNKKMQQDNIPDTLKTRVSKQAVNSVGKGGSRMWLKAGQMVSLRDLKLGIAVHSGNDATVAAAEAVAGTESHFVHFMNRTAKQLGLHHTHFQNTSGLSVPQHVSTAYDLALLTQAFIRDFPHEYKIFKKKCFTYQGRTDCVTNFLLWEDPSVDGVKTGRESDAGYCLIASAKRKQMRLISVVLNTKSRRARVDESKKLLEYGFRHYNTLTLAQAGKTLAKPRCWLSQSKHVAAGVNKPIILTLPRLAQKRLHTHMQFHEPLTAPVQQGDPLGTFIVTLDGRLKAQHPLIALESIPKAGPFTQVKDRIYLSLQGLFR